MSLRRILSRYRVVFLAILVSAAIHAMVIVGVPEIGGASEDGEPAVAYTADLDESLPPSTTEPAPARAPKAAAPKPRARAVPRPRPSPPKPEEMIAQAPAPAPAIEAPAAVTPGPVAAPPVATEPDLPPEPELPPAPEKVALAPVVAPQPAPKVDPFTSHALPGHLKIVYELTSIFADGRATYQWDRDGDNYVITGEAEAEGFFTLFLEGHATQESRGKITANGLQPERFSESLPKQETEGIEFDWTNRKITFEHGGVKEVNPLMEDTVDWLSMIFQLAHRPPKGDFDLRVYTQKHLYVFHLKMLGEEEIEIPIGKVRAVHLRHFDAQKNETVDVWLGIDQHFVPVKMRYPVARNRFMVEQTASRLSEE
jgi:hypothetical protein